MPEKQKMQTVYKRYDFIRSTTLRMPAFRGQKHFPKLKEYITSSTELRPR